MLRSTSFAICLIGCVLSGTIAQGAQISYFSGASFSYGWTAQSTASFVSRGPAVPNGFQQDSMFLDSNGAVIAPPFQFEPLPDPIADSSDASNFPLPWASASANINGFFSSTGIGTVGASAGTTAGHSPPLTPEINPSFALSEAQVSAQMFILFTILPDAGETSANFNLNFDVLVDPGDILGTIPFVGTLLKDTEWEISLSGPGILAGVGNAGPSPLNGSFSVPNIPFNGIYGLFISTEVNSISQSSMDFIPDPSDPTKFIVSDISGIVGDISQAQIGFNFDVTGNTPPPNPNPIPEPSTMLLFGSGLAGLIGWRKWKSKTA